MVELLDLALRGGVCMTLALVAGLLGRDYRASRAARLGAAFALGVGAYAICSTPGLHERLGLWATPILGLAAGNNLVFWLFAKSLFDDDFRLRPWHGAAWAVLAVLGVLSVEAPFGASLRTFLNLAAASFAILALAEALATWRADLVAPRRRFRLFLVGGVAAHILLTSLPSVLMGAQIQAPTPSLASALGMAAIALAVAWSLMRIEGRGLLDLAVQAPAPTPSRAIEPGLSAADQQHLAALAREMAEERAYRDEQLTIGALAARIGAPEHRLRRLINQHLGHRNFNAFVNGYRLGEVKAALADPIEASTPVLTLALDAGFASLGPFNRAFRADTGLTPTEFRKAALEKDPPDSESASRISKSA